jgi:hypothetical protein
MFLLWTMPAFAGIVNVEFKFTPFVGNPAAADHVTTVPGRVSVQINGVPIAEEEVEEKEAPVLFQEREIAPSVWLPVDSHRPLLRRGKNTVRILFEPADPRAKYRAQLRWAQVTDQTRRVEEGAGRLTETNQTGEGVMDREVNGPVTMEREFTADFADDLGWHHYPAVKSLNEDDRKDLARLARDRLALFRPDFSSAYGLLSKMRNIDLDGIRKAKCLDRGYAAGLRIKSQPIDRIDFILTGNQEVIIMGKGDSLFLLEDPKVIDRINGDEMQMCVFMTLSALYPPRLVVVRSPAGVWEVVH